MGTFGIVYWIIVAVQGVLVFWAAYNAAKLYGDDAPDFYMRRAVYGLAAFIPGLGFWLWFKYRDDGGDRNRDMRDDMPRHEQRRGK